MATYNNDYELGTLRDRDVSPIMETLIANTPSLFKVIGTGQELKNNKFEWLEKQLTPSSWTITGFTTDGDGVGLEFASTTGIVAGMILMFKKATGAYVTEYVKVASVTNTTTIVTTRDYDSTTGVTLVIGDVAHAFDSKQEGFTSGSSAILAPTENYNYSVIDSEDFFLSRNAMASAKIGGYDPFADGVKDAATKLLWKQTNRLLYGRRVVRSLSNGGGGTMGLIQALTGGNVNTTGGAIGTSHINSAIESIVNDGALPTKLLLVMNTNQAKKITALNSVTHVTTDGIVGGTMGGSVRQFIPDFQLMGMESGASIFIETSMPKDMILVINPELIKVRYWLKPSVTDVSTPNIDGKSFQVKTEYGFEIKNGTTAHGMITGLAI